MIAIVVSCDDVNTSTHRQSSPIPHDLVPFNQNHLNAFSLRTVHVVCIYCIEEVMSSMYGISISDEAVSENMSICQLQSAEMNENVYLLWGGELICCKQQITE